MSNKNINPFFEHLALVDDAGKMIEHSKLRLYELKGRLESEMDKADRNRFDKTVKSQLKIDSNVLKRELKEILQKLEQNGKS